MSRPTIIINDLDAERIDILLEQPAYAGLPIADALNAELDRAQMCSPEEMPHDVVTMNSRVKFRNLSDGEVRVRFAQRMHSHPLYAKAAIFPGSHCSLLLQNYSVSFVGITMAEAFYILIGFLIMAVIIVMAVLYLENHS